MRSLVSLLLTVLVGAAIASYTAGQTRASKSLGIYVVEQSRGG